MADTPEEDISLDPPDREDALIKDEPYSGALDPELVAKSETIARSIDGTLNAFRSVFEKLRVSLEAHSENVSDGTLKASELKSDMRQVVPLLSITIQQESKVNDTIEQRVGKAGRNALDLGKARSEIWSRLTCLRRAEERRGVSERAE